MTRPSNDTQPKAAGWASRLAAAELMLAVEEGAEFESAMQASRAFGRLQGPDRGFARAMASAALRAMGRIDWALGGMLERPLDDIEPPLRALLRIGAAQLWLMGVADHAAVSATVEAARQWHPARRGGGLVNAVLRRAGREAAAFAASPASAVWPDWLAARMKAALGVARAEALALAQLDEPPIDLTLRDVVDAAVWADRLGAELLPNGSLRLPGGAGLAVLPGYEDGAWWVQDTAASLPARLMGDIQDKAVADLCAAPGGKALQLAAFGARVSAVEISRQRIVRLRENAARAKLDLEIIEADARTWRPAEPLDAVLIDAPCSALGVIRRHPEGVWRRDPKDLARFPATQRALVDAAHDMLRPGGRLVYAVCTPMPEEGRDIIDAAVATGAWRRLAVAPGEIPAFAHALTEDGDVLTAPRGAEDPSAGDSGPDSMKSDVFFIARLERV